MTDSVSKLQGILKVEQVIPHGTFNSLAVNKNPNKNLMDRTGYDPLNSLREDLIKKYTPDVYSDKIEWNAIVLRVIDPTDMVYLNPLFIAITSLLETTDDSLKNNTVKFIARIPEIHGCLPVPNILQDGYDEISLAPYPIFEGARSLGVPAEGDIVRVTFDNLNDFSGPKYIGPISSPGNITGLGNIQEISAANAFNSTQINTISNVPNLSNINNNPARKGHSAYNGFPSTQISIDTAKTSFPHILYDRAIRRGFNTDLVPVPQISNDQHVNVYISVAVAEVIEQYWRQQFPEAYVNIIFNVRNRSERDPFNSHGIGAAIDFVVYIDANNTIPILQTWSCLTKLAKAGRIPLGGRGLYLNTSTNGIKGIKPEECGEASPGQGKPKSALPKGGSAGIHYDWRSSFGNFRGPRGGKPTTWISTDTTGDGHDEYELGQWQTIQTSTTKKGDRALPDGSNIAPGYDHITCAPNYVYNYLENTLPDILKYFRQNGNNDSYLPEVKDTVFNVLQILGLEE